MTPIGAISQTVLRNDLAVRTITVEKAVITRAEQTFNNLKGPFKAAAEASEYQSVNMKGWKYTKKATGSTAALEKELKRLGGKVDKVERTTQTFGKRLDDFFSRLNKLGDKFDALIQNIGQYLRNVPGLTQVLDAAATPSGQRFFSWVAKVGSKLLVILQILDLLGSVANVTAWWYNINRVNQLQTRMDALEKEVGKILSNLATFKSRLDKMQASLQGISLGELQKLRDDSRVLALKFNDFGTKFNTLSQTVNTQKQSLLDQARRILTLEGLVKTFVTFIVFRQSIDYLSGLVGQLRQQSSGFQNSIQFLSGKVGGLQTQVTGLASRVVGAETKAAQALAKAAVPGPAGKQGAQGLPGIPGLNGRNGIDGKNGLPGLNGKNGINGVNGRDGVTTVRNVEVPVYVDRTVVVQTVDPTLKAEVLQARLAAQQASSNSAAAATAATAASAKLGAPLPNGGISAFLLKMQQFAETAWRATHMDKVLNVLTLVTSLHNAMMLSRSLGSTLGELTGLALQVIGIKDETGGAIDINQVLGGLTENFIKSIVGEQTYNDTKKKWAAFNRIVQSTTQIVWTVRSMADSTGEIIEWAAENTGKIGNALKRFGVVGERAYKWMPERVRRQDAWSRKLDRVREGVESLDDAASSLTGALGEVRSIQEEFGELNEQKQNLATALKDGAALVRPDNEPVKQAADAAKTASGSPDLTGVSRNSGG
jgi:hypothetical protein